MNDPIKHGQGCDEQDEREDTAILTALSIFAGIVIVIVGAIAFAIGYWFTGVRLL